MAADVKRANNVYIAAVDSIFVEEGFNPRFDFGEIETLAESMKSIGFRKNKPLTCRRGDDGKLLLIDGERRWRAAKLAGIESVPIVIEAVTGRGAALLMALTDNTGKPLLPLEEAAALKELHDSGMSVLNIAKMIGRSDIYVADRLKLLTAPESVQEKVREGSLPATNAAEILNKEKDPAKQEELAEKAASGNEGRRAVRKELAERGGIAKAVKTQVPKHVREMLREDLGKMEVELLKQAEEVLEYLELPFTPEEMAAGRDNIDFMNTLFLTGTASYDHEVTVKGKTKQASTTVHINNDFILNGPVKKAFHLASMISRVATINAILGDD